MIEVSKYQNELDKALEAAEEAGKIMNSFQEDKIEVKDRKERFSHIVTAADLECQKKIVEIIKQEFSEDGFLGEEEHLKPEDEKRVWIIDPIDGTCNFEKGFEFFCTSIALKVDGEYKVGVVHSPETGLDETFVAVAGEGAYKISGQKKKKLSVSNQEFLKGGLFSSHISSGSADRRKFKTNANNALLSEGMIIRDVGSYALGLSKLAEGKLDGFFEFIREWDYAAAHLIVEEAGGETHTKSSKYGKRDTVVASNGKIQRELLSTLREHQEWN